jgi:AAA domain/UvrD-like helicase C-terminal domain
VPRITPTPEQEAALAAFLTGDHLALQAGAGSGKTATLRAMARSSRDRRGLYLAFNRAIANEARATFPRTTFCTTAHSLAWRAIGRRYQNRLNAPRMSSAKLAALLHINPRPIPIGERDLTASALCYVAQQTVLAYCHSADPAIAASHVPWPRGITEEAHHDRLAEIVLPYAQQMWADLRNPHHGTIRFHHDHYLKMWALDEPTLPQDVLLLDEAQDTNPVLEKVFTAQREHAQLVMVGDSAQAIYGWRGARDVMTTFDATALTLSRSFRFGGGVAAEANRWLAIAGQPLRITGAPNITSTVTSTPAADGQTARAILCRTNGGAMTEILALLSSARRVALVGDGKPLQELATAARDLQNGRRTTHPELMLFSSWGEVRDYAEYDPTGRDLQPLVEVVDEHGVDVILDTLTQLCREGDADATVSTIHRSKGREWTTVRISDDFPEPEDPDHTDVNGKPLPVPIDPGEARLAYVAVTRARHHLDLGGLSWINRHPDGNPAAA